MRTFRPNKPTYFVIGFVVLALGLAFLALGLYWSEPIPLFAVAWTMLLAIYFFLLGSRFKVVVSEEWLVVEPIIGRPIPIPWREIYNVDEVFLGDYWVLRIYVKGRKPITLPYYMDEVGELAQILFAKVEKRIGPKHLK